MGTINAGVVVVGAGQAASQLLASLRQMGYSGPLTLVGEEKYLPYQRPPLSKTCLRESPVVDELLLRPQSFYESIECRVLIGVRAQSIDRQNKKLILSDGVGLGYDALVIATGAAARHWPGLVPDQQHVFSLRSLDDGIALQRRMKSIKSLAILGGGYVGLEVAASATQRGLQVTVFEGASRLMQRSVGPDTSTLVAGLHREKGTLIHCGVQVQAITLTKAGDGSSMVHMDTSGGLHSAEALVVGIGADARKDLAQGAGLNCGAAIRVDAQCRTSDPDIFAIGDCAEQVLDAGGEATRLESVANAIDQAKCVAALLSGKSAPPAPVPWFWSDQYSHRIQVAGIRKPGDQTVIRKWANKPDTQATWYLRDSCVVAVETVNAVEDFMTARQWIKNRQSLDPTQLANTVLQLRSLVQPSA